MTRRKRRPRVRIELFIEVQHKGVKMAEMMREFPATVPSLVVDLAKLGVKTGMTLVVHSSLKALGEVNGGPVAVILALEEMLGVDGALVMPTFTADNSEPANWQNPAV